MSTFQLKITSPDGILFQGKVTGLSLRSTEGDLAILAGHTPLMATVVPCACKLTLEDDSEKSGRLSGGLLEVRGEETVLFTKSVAWEP